MGYYFACTRLAPLSFDVKPEMNFQEVRQMLDLNLSPKDQRKVKRLVGGVDLYNIKALWLGLPDEEWKEKGNYSPQELEEVLLGSEQTPPFLADFLQKYESTEERLRYFPALWSAFYDTEEESGFLRRYFRLEKDIQLILTALRSKTFHRDLTREMQFEDPQDSFVAYILAQKDTSEFIPPHEYEELKVLFEDHSSDPESLAQVILEYRFRKIEELEEGKPFSIDCILGYLARLILVEEWQRLDREKGNVSLQQLSENG